MSMLGVAQETIDKVVLCWREDLELFPARTLGPEWNQSQRSLFLLSPHHLPSTSDDMGLRDLLPSILKKIRAQVCSKARSEASPVRGPSDDNPVLPCPAESTPDLGIASSNVPTPSFKISPPPDQQLKGMQTARCIQEELFNNPFSFTT